MKHFRTLSSLFFMLLVSGFLALSLPTVLADSATEPLPELQTPQQIVDKLLRDNHIPAEKVSSVKLDKQNVLNAYTDGRNIVITQKLWNALKTNDERAFVVSHELGHIMANHITKAVLRNTGFSILTRVVAEATGNAWLTVGTDLGLKLTNMKFSRTQELEADERGIIEMKTAGYNPNAALAVFKVLQGGDGSNKGKATEFLKTHPIPQSRIEQLVKKHGLTSDSTTAN
jgi:predicted Zn-dependent protease